MQIFTLFNLESMAFKNEKFEENKICIHSTCITNRYEALTKPKDEMATEKLV